MYCSHPQECLHSVDRPRATISLEWTASKECRQTLDNQGECAQRRSTDRVGADKASIEIIRTC